MNIPMIVSLSNPRVRSAILLGLLCALQAFAQTPDSLGRFPVNRTKAIDTARSRAAQAADEMVFDWSTSRRSFVPGAHSVVSAEGGVGDQTSGWDGKQYVVRIKPQMGPLITDSFGLSADGKHLVEKVHVDQYELPAVTITRTYNPTTETGPRPLSSGD